MNKTCKYKGSMSSYIVKDCLKEEIPNGRNKLNFETNFDEKILQNYVYVSCFCDLKTT